jgi:4-hydroxy-4-methyl-2-oxoglutarate aldolase
LRRIVLGTEEIKVKHQVIRNILRADAGLISTLGGLGVATIHESQGRTGVMKPYMRPIYSSARVAGSAVTVSCQPGDNWLVHAALDVCQPGDVLVVSPTSVSTDGMFGELLGTSCQARGVVGLVIDAGVRDVAELTAMDFPIWSKAISAQGAVKASAGSVNIQVVCAGQIVNPGDVIVGDLDGIVVVKRESAAEVARLAQNRIDEEQKKREKLKAGELGLDLYGFREKLKALGVEWVD